MSFLKRFSHPHKRHVPTDELEHVISNITAVLNTKQGFGSVVRQLGIGEYFERLSSRDALVTLQTEIEEEIRKFEPRLSDFEIESLGKTADLHMVFELRGIVAGARCRLRILFSTMFGNVVIERLAP